MEKRTYRPVQPSDLPQIQSGKLKAFFESIRGYLPVKLVSTRINKNNFWIIDNGEDDYWANNDSAIVVDVTPEKRYALWDHKLQRFADNEAIPYMSREAAEIEIAAADRKRYYVIEWEIKNND